MEINMLPVSRGDCIHIRFQDNMGIHNIVVDSGQGKTKRKFRALLQHIADSGEHIDLLCFTHIDDDHIRAASQIIPEEDFIDNQLIHEVWLNVGQAGVQSVSANQSKYYNMTVHDAGELWGVLQNKGIPVLSDIVCGQQFRIGEAVIEIISPSERKHEKYFKYWEEEYKKHPFGAGYDPSDTNGDSIAFVLTLRGRHYVFLGDAHASVITKSLGNRFLTEGIELVKLSHHGSIHNINEKLLHALNTRRFLISSESDAPRPSQETMNLIEGWKPEEEKWMYCNFDCDLEVQQPEKLHVVTLDEQKTTLDEADSLYSEDYDD